MSKTRRWTSVPPWEWDAYRDSVAATEPPHEADSGTGAPHGEPHLPSCVPNAEWPAYVNHIATQ